MAIPVLERINVRELLNSSEPFTTDHVEKLRRVLGGTQVVEARQEIERMRREVDAASKPPTEQLTRVGIGLYLLGRHREAEGYLRRAAEQGNALAAYYLAIVLSNLERHEEAAAQFEKAAEMGFDAVECTLRRAGEIRRLGNLEEAEKVLRSTGAAGAKRAEYSYQMGCLLADRGDTFGAIEYFERAVDMDPRHSRALFSLANLYSQLGDDEEAIRLYEQSLSKPPQHLGALINLGLMYEDAENYKAAAFCFRRALEVDPTNERARLYLKDIEATGDMYYDEEALREQSRLQHLLSRPVTDFELTVRSRNCLERMGIRTLGDLTEVSEQDLLASRNFGETSLREVRELMERHGLRIGQNLHQVVEREPEVIEELPPEKRAVLEMPISDLNLSVRARKCMNRLGITTVGELIRRTPDELLATKNFGVTSLNEVRAKLEELGLKLRND